MTDLTEPVIISLIGATLAIMSLLFRLLYRSKCDTIETPCLKIHRNTSQELTQQDSVMDIKV